MKLPSSLMEGKEFRALTPSEKLYYILVLSRLSARGKDEKPPFYASDLQMAVTLGLAEATVRRARRKLVSMGWLTVKPGFMNKGKNVATRYLAAAHVDVPEGDSWSKFHRFTFEAVLHSVRNKDLGAADALVYAYLAYWQQRMGQKDGKFFITKRQLREFVGTEDAPTRAETLADWLHLFKCQDTYHRIEVRDWHVYADPSENPKNKEVAEEYAEEITMTVWQIQHRSTTT